MSIILSPKEELQLHIDIFKSGIPIQKIKPLKNETYKILVKSKSPVHIVNREGIYGIVGMIQSKIAHFINNLPLDNSGKAYFYAIPIQTINGNIAGMIFRNILGKSTYYSFFPKASEREKSISLNYGFYPCFQDFDREERSNCFPVVIVEGLKDAIFLKQFYPYVIANNTSSLGFNAQILRNITDRILLCYDNDKTGKMTTESDLRLLKSLRFKVRSFDLPPFVKDAGELINYPDKINQFKEGFMSILEQLDRE